LKVLVRASEKAMDRLGRPDPARVVAAQVVGTPSGPGIAVGDSGASCNARCDALHAVARWRRARVPGRADERGAAGPGSARRRGDIERAPRSARRDEGDARENARDPPALSTKSSSGMHGFDEHITRLA
jgi:hypothetical protein